MRSVIPQTINQLVDAHQDWRETLTYNVLELNAELTKTVLKTLPVFPTDVSTPACLKTLVHPLPLVPFKTIMLSVLVHQDGSETHLYPVLQKRHQLFLNKSLSAMWMVTVQMILHV
jgi:hypothetical protein